MGRTLTVTAPTPCRLAKCSEYGKEGDITGADGDEQEISVLSLHPLQSALVHLNTIFLQRVLDGGDLTLAGEDRRALSPLFWSAPAPTGERRVSTGRAAPSHSAGTFSGGRTP